MSNDTPLFSVIVPTHNGADRLDVSLGSVVKQTCRNYELIVVCDACDDHSEEIAKTYGAKVISVDVHRDGLARNAGLDAASGEWILFLDDDDYFLHEYCFNLLAQKIDECGNDLDVIYFTFIWRGKGYFIPKPELICSMVWCKAWKRSFIGEKRFDSSMYGSDSNFFDQYVKSNPECRYTLWNVPMYYYNYFREGSMSWMLQNKQKTDLDIIITHYNEPWETGKKLFDSIALQQCVDMSRINVILVQDGPDGDLQWDELLAQYHYNVDIYTLGSHCGVSEARNKGLDHARADWVLFSDFDDMLADIATLSMVVQLFPVDSDVDIIWSEYVREVSNYIHRHDTAFNCERETDFRLIGKLYRRQFLKDHNVRFNTLCNEYSDMVFNAIAFAETYPHRVAKFNAPFFPYFKSLRMDGAFSTLDALHNRVASQFMRDLYLAAEMDERGKTAKYKNWMVRAIADAYHSIRSTDLEPDEHRGVTKQLIEFWAKYRDVFSTISENDIDVALDESQTEAMTFIQEYYNYYGKEYYLQNDMISFKDFCKYLDKQASIDTSVQSGPEPEHNIITMPVSDTPINSGDRVVVYCGTKNTYVNMIASVKSLLATTHVDKVYFLIEDDEFPYPIPDIIETRNVSNTGLFDPNGPNYGNVWTYMCLMRTAYPDMFPQYDKILSLDIDVVITEDVGDLWNIDLTDYYYAGVAEEGRIKDNSQDIYANFGVIMMNLQKLRADGMGKRLIEAVNTEHFGCPEQDAFNKYCKGYIYQLPNDYNVTVYSHITGEPLRERILHYAGLKYWKHFGPVKKYYNLSWEEIMNLQEQTHG